MRDCYKILGVSKNATAAEIRRAYRQKAKLLHPDTTHEDPDAFRALVEASEVLSDVKSRSLFDESYNGSTNDKNPFFHYHKDSFDYRTWLLAREDDESQSKLIFFDLMHNREDNAVAEYKQMNMTRTHFRL